MRLKIPLQAILNVYSNSDMVFICDIIRLMNRNGTINLGEDMDTSLATSKKVSNQVREFFAGYFQQKDTIEVWMNTIPAWFFHVDDIDRSKHIQPFNGEPIKIADYNNSREVRLFMMQYIIDRSPDAQIVIDV